MIIVLACGNLYGRLGAGTGVVFRRTGERSWKILEKECGENGKKPAVRHMRPRRIGKAYAMQTPVLVCLNEYLERCRVPKGQVNRN